MPPRRREWLDLLTVAGFCAFLFFYGLGAFGLVGADEPRYAQIAREMLQRHDFVVPYLYGKPWLEKPALFYWLAALSYKLFGVSDWAARLPSAVLSTVMVFAVYFHARRFRPGSELNAALMTAASAALIGFSRSASTDLPLAACFAIGMLAWYTWLAGGGKLWLALFFVFMALGTLSKGPVAPALAGLIIILFAFRERDWRIVWRTLWLPGIALFLLVALPWFIAVQMRIPTFFREFFLQHNLERFAVQNLYHRHQPFWYYIPVLLLGTMPWTVPFVAGFAEHVRNFRERAEPGEAHDPMPRFFVLWIVVVVLFFSLSQSKLPGYILPAIPPCTMLAADWLQRRGAGPIRWWIAALHAAIVAALTCAAVVAPLFVVAKAEGAVLPMPPPLKMFAGLITLFAFAGVFLTVRSRGVSMLRFATLAPLIFALAWLLRAGAPAIDAALSARTVARETTFIAGKNSTVALFSPGLVTGESRLRELEYGLAFYLDHPIPTYDKGQIPSGDHLVIARKGFEHQIADAVGGRRVSRLGDFPTQRLEFFWISPPTPPAVSPEEHHHHH